MNIDKIVKTSTDLAKNKFNLHERRPGQFQLIVPIFHGDGDTVDIYLQTSPILKNHIRHL